MCNGKAKMHACKRVKSAWCDDEEEVRRVLMGSSEEHQRILQHVDGEYFEAQPVCRFSCYLVAVLFAAQCPHNVSLIWRANVEVMVEHCVTSL